MNKHCFRIIFNELRGQWMAVQECATSLGKGKTNSTPLTKTKQTNSKLGFMGDFKQVCGALLLGLGALYSANAQIVADPNAAGQNQPNIITPPNTNNVPVVNITAPSAGGVSHNRYDQFDVQQQGVILNNSVTNAQTQLGGWIQGNANLANGPARVILNEVTSGDPSVLRGFIEVAGQRAEVIIANPAGISVNGGGVINAAGLTLTTGLPQFNQYGGLDSFRVGGGRISIDGAGLNSSTADYTQLISRAVEVNSGLWANDLRITAGTGDIGVDGAPIQLTVEDADGKPLYAIDVSYLGGMYAGKISLVGTESGVGVQNAGHIGATAGQIAITADGQLVNAGEISSTGPNSQVNVNVQGNIDNQGVLSSQGNTQLQSTQQITNTGVIDGRTTLVQAQTIDNVGSGRIYGDHLALAADTLKNREATVNGEQKSAVIAARERLDIGVRELINRENSFIYSAGDMSIGGSLDANRQAQGRAELVQNDGARIEAGANMWIAADQINNTNTNFESGYEVTPYDGPAWTIGYNGKTYDPLTVKIWINGVLHDMPTDSNGNADVGGLWYLVYANKKQALMVVYPDGNASTSYYVQQINSQNLYTPITVKSQAGEITAGNQMLLDGDLLNDKSRILAGGTVNVTGSSQLIDAKANQYVERTGIWTHIIFENDHISSSQQGALHDRIANTQVSLIVAAPTSNSSDTSSGTNLPDNSFFTVNPGSDHKYLVETDPRFAQYGKWLTSDYMLDSLGLDPALMQKRYGDGFYEQKLIREQIGSLTGFRFLAGYGSDEEQYSALMNSGVAFAKKYNLAVGVELTADQMANLTDDIVWLVSEDVTLPNGRVESVLVPRVYARSGTSIVTAGGSLISGNDVLFANTTNTPVTLDNSATIAARNNLVVDVDRVQNNVGQIHGDNVYLHAATDIDNKGGSISADSSLILDAGRNVNIASSVIDGYDINGHFTEVGNIGFVGVTGENNNSQVIINAGNDVNLNAAVLSNTSEDGNTTIAAGNDINVGTVTTTYQTTRRSSSSSRSHSGSYSGSQEIGSTIVTSGDLNMVANNDVVIRGSNLASNEGAININANTITVEASSDSNNSSVSNKHKSSEGLMTIVSTQRSERAENTVNSSTLSAEQINLQSNKDLNIIGSNVVATHDVNLTSAEGDVNVIAGTGDLMQYDSSKIKSSGASYAGGLSVTVGMQQTTSKDLRTSDYVVGSSVGSLDGSLNISARNGSYNQIGSNSTALKGDINVVAQDINIVEARESSHRQSSQKTQSIGLTVGLGGGSPTLATLENANTMMGIADQTGSGRMQALAGGAIALNAYNNAAGIKNEFNTAKDSLTALSQGDLRGAIPNTGFKLNFSLNASKSKTESTQDTQTAVGSNMQANNINLVATGKTNTATGKSEDGNITIRGSNITASQDIALTANDQVNILAASNTDNFKSTSSNQSASLGGSIGVGEKGLTVGANAAFGAGNGKQTSAEQTWTHSHVNAGKTLTIISGGDTNIIGGQVAGDKVQANIGGNLNIESLQDTYTSKSSSHQSNVGISAQASITPTGAIVPTGGGASVSINSSKSESNYANVNEYSGINAGNGGFNVNVAGNTDLKGAAISSTQEAIDNNLNQLTTGSITTSDIHNHSDASAKTSGISLNSNMLDQGKYGVAKDVIGSLLANNSAAVNEDGVTRSSVSAGTINITDEQKQQELTGSTANETVDSLNRDTVNAHTGVGRLSAAELEAKLQAENAIKQSLYGESVKITDGAYKTMFQDDHKIYRVLRNEDGSLKTNTDGTPAKVELTNEEKQRLQAGSDGKVNVFINGIFNDAEAASRYAVFQNETASDSDPIYLVHFPETGGFLEEMLVAGYQKNLEGDLLGLTNSTSQVVDIMEQYGQTGLNLVGHSRGSMTIGNAMTSVGSQSGSNGALSGTNIFFNGPAYNAEKAADQLYQLSDQKQNTVTLQNHAYDIVGSWPIILGGNPGTHSDLPSDSKGLITEVPNLGNKITVHSCYGSGKAGCEVYGKPISVPIVAPRSKAK